MPSTHRYTCIGAHAGRKRPNAFDGSAVGRERERPFVWTMFAGCCPHEVRPTVHNFPPDGRRGPRRGSGKHWPGTHRGHNRPEVPLGARVWAGPLRAPNPSIHKYLI